MQTENEDGFLLFCTSVPLVEVLQARLGPWGHKCIPTAHSVFVQLQSGLNCSAIQLMGVQKITAFILPC